MDAERIQMASSLFCGRSSEPWRDRVHGWFQIFDSLYQVKPAKMTPGNFNGYNAGPNQHRFRALGPDRSEAQLAAQQLLEDLFGGRIQEMTTKLASTFWAAWPNGRFLIHKTVDLNDGLISKHPDWEEKVKFGQWRVYHFGEIKKGLQRGLPEILDAFLGLQNALLVTVTVSVEAQFSVRLMMAMEKAASGDWKSRNLPMVSPDDVQMASISMTSLESATCKRAYTFIRGLVLGHLEPTQTLETYFTPHVWLNNKRYNTSEIRDLLAKEPFFAQSSETGITDISEMSTEKLRKKVPKLHWEQFEKYLKHTQLRPLVRIRTTALECTVGTYDPKNRTFRNRISVFLVLVIDEAEGTGHESIKISAIFQN
ncbi:MAG: hypothetical protein VYC39_01115 [Myxococcota bacterium]|nr:hypothetical protein [Myxococcota bacterium]